MTYYSQAGQDKWVHGIIGDKGVFVDVGAYDGVQTSNTYALELLGWMGICIEANPEEFYKLNLNRRCTCINRVVTSYKGTIPFYGMQVGGGRFELCDTLHNILIDSFCPPAIDYLSLDIEGHELTVLKAFNFTRWQVRLITVEHNLYLDGPGKKDALFELLTSNGFTRVFEDVKCLDPNPLYFNKPFEDWYENNLYKS